MFEKINNEINYGTELSIKVEEKNMELSGICVLNIHNYRRLIKSYDLLKKLALLNDGGVVSVSIEHNAEYAEVDIEVPSIELYKEGLEQFCELLGLVDLINVSNTGNDSVLIKVGVSGLWEAVSSSE